MSSPFLLFVSLSLVLSHSLSLCISTVIGLKRCRCMLRIISCAEQNLGQSCRSRGWWSMWLCTCGTIINTFLPQGASASLYPHSAKWWSFLNRQAMQGKSSWCFYLFIYLPANVFTKYTVGWLHWQCCHREVVLLVLLCDAVAQGIIQPWCETSRHTSQEWKQPQANKTQKNGRKEMEKSGFTHTVPLEAAAVQDIKKALQVRDCFISSVASFSNLQPSHSIVLG